MDLRNLATFIQVAELGSFTKAAEKLGYSQPTISFQIKQLETELGAQLFERIGHTVALTDRGHTALSYAQNICRMTQTMINGTEIVNQAKGIIRLAMADSLCPSLIENNFAEFHRQYPGVALNVTTAGTGELFRLVDRNEVDIVCTLDTHIYNTSYIIADEEKVGVHFVASPLNPIVKKEDLTKSDLLSESFILTEKGMSYRRIMDEKFAEEKIEISPILEISSTAIICKLIEANAGVSFLPNYITEKAVNEGKLVRLNVTDFKVDVWKQLLYHRDKWISPQMQAALDFLSKISINHFHR